jgi:site-specific DNA recombinase
MTHEAEEGGRDLVSDGRALTYLRVSSKRQMDTAADIDADGNSIATQRDFALRRTATLGTAVRREYLEPGTSAQTIEKRPVFRQMLRFIKEHPGEIDYVVIYMRSRAFRNYIDAGVTERQLAALGVKLVSAKEDFGEGIWADAMKGVADIMNEVQVRMSGEDIRTKMEHKARSGGTIGRARLGYKNVRAEHEGRLVNTVAIDPVRAPLVRQAFELYSAGDLSVERLSEVMADLGLTTRATAKWHEKPVSDSKLHTMLQDPYYVGFMPYKGELLPGRHEPIISQALFDQVQEVLKARSARGQRDRVIFHYLKGMLFCQRCHESGRMSRLIYTEASGRNGELYAYFFCLGRREELCDLPYLPVAQVERGIEADYATLQLAPAFIDEVQELVRATMTEQKESVQFLHDTLRKQLARLDVQEERLIDLAADGSLPQSKIRARLNKLALDRNGIQAGLARTGDELKAGSDLLMTSLDLCRDPAALYRRAPDEVRRSINETFTEHYFIDDHGHVTESVRRPPFDDFPRAADAYYRRSGTGGGEAGSPRHQPPAQGKQKAPGCARGPGDPPGGSLPLGLAEIFLADVSNKTILVGVAGFEPTASSSRTKRATKLRHTPAATGPA